MIKACFLFHVHSQTKGYTNHIFLEYNLNYIRLKQINLFLCKIFEEQAHTHLNYLYLYQRRLELSTLYNERYILYTHVDAAYKSKVKGV